MAKEVWVNTLGNVKIAVMTSWVPSSAEVLTTMAKAGSEVKGVKAIDFGQGDCNAIVAKDGDGNDKPILFFDLGGGCGQCSRTHRHHPTHGKAGEKGWGNIAPKIDTTHKPTVILSHWDKDHYFSATKAEAKVKGLNWLVPRQKIGPQCVKFVRKLTNIRCFPNGAPGVRYQLLAQTGHTDLYIEQATDYNAADRNLSGLICTLVKHDGAGADQERIVMPGDAPYHKIPSLSGGASPGGTVKKLFAYHHGSREHMNHAKARIPNNPGGGHLLQMTYGLTTGGKNHYGHPNKDAVAQYKAKGWTTRTNTASANPTDMNSATTGQNPATRSDRTVYF